MMRITKKYQWEVTKVIMNHKLAREIMFKQWFRKIKKRKSKKKLKKTKTRK